MENQLTKELAIQNIRIALEQFRGTRSEHITLEESLKLLTKEDINK